MNLKTATYWSVFWIGLSLILCGAIAFTFGRDAGTLFLSGYIVEKMLSFDNLFMFYVIFNYFKLNSDTQRKSLNYGIVGAMVFRAILIIGGAALVSKFHGLIYLFGGFLLYTGINLFYKNDGENKAPEGIINFLLQKFNITTFWMCVATIEITDILFALDSIPAIFGITTNPWIIYSSNLCAILGLRSLYFVMLALIEKFCYLQMGVATILTFIGAKMLLGYMYEIPNVYSLTAIVSIISVAVIASMYKEKKVNG